jgi:hypothetical protein
MQPSKLSSAKEFDAMIAPRPFTRALRSLIVSSTLLVPMLVAGGTAQAQSWATCLEAIVKTQHELKNVLPKTAQPPTQMQSVAAQDSHEPTPGSLAAAGLEAPTTGPAAALNEAQNLQALGDEAGCMKAVTKARELGGLK